jgi:hypothetical protein
VDTDRTNEPDPDTLEGDLGTVTDLDWLEAHLRLIGDNPDMAAAGELNYRWEPNRPGEALIGAGERDTAPRHGEFLRGGSHADQG